MTALPPIEVLGVRVISCDVETAVATVIDGFAAGRTQRIAFLNHNLAVRLLERGRLCILDAFIVLNDGLALDIAARLLRGRRFAANLNGTDLTPKILAALPKSARIFLYGARPEVVAEAARRLTARGHRVVGFCDGYSCDGATAAAAAREAGAEVALVALGNPQQELWIADYGAESGARLFLGIGAWFDFMTGATRRAPAAIRRARLEWLYRLTLEPKRLMRRYTIDAARFFVAALRHG